MLYHHNICYIYITFLNIYEWDKIGDKFISQENTEKKCIANPMKFNFLFE